jgi:circadian clock protein KaiC
MGNKTPKPRFALKKSLTGISGFDEITRGGLPTGRPTLLCGGAGCGKSLFATEFLVRGAVEFDEPGVLLTFEETVEDIKKNVASLGFDLDRLMRQKKLVIDHAVINRSEIQENGEYNLDGLFIRLEYAVKSIGAKRVVLDTIESLFAGLSNAAVLRAEIRRLFDWLRDHGLTTIVTGERGEGQLTRQGLEEYVSDCVILLDNRIDGQISTRRLRVVKYRGSFHGTNEYPFLIDDSGISVMPITASTMDYPVTNERISTGIADLDEMLGGHGFYRGSTILLSGTAGTGKSSVAGHFTEAACLRGERSLYFSFEESPAQIMRNMSSIGIHLEKHVRKGLLQFHSTRPTIQGFEMHLVRMHKLIREFRPAVVVIDPVFELTPSSASGESTQMLVRLIDFLRKQNITGFIISLSKHGDPLESTQQGISSMVDTWLLLRDIEAEGERNRAVYVLKSRGMAHSNQVREFVITAKGVKLLPPYYGPKGAALTGSARLSSEATSKIKERIAQEEGERAKAAFRHRQAALAAQIAGLQAQVQAAAEEFERSLVRVRVKQGAAPGAARRARPPEKVSVLSSP